MSELDQKLQATQILVEDANRTISELQKELQEALDEALKVATQRTEDEEKIEDLDKKLREKTDRCERAEEALWELSKAKKGKSSCRSAQVRSLIRAVDAIANTKVTNAVVVFQADPLTDTSPELHASPDLTPSPPAVERTPTICNHADAKNESDNVEPEAGSGAIHAPLEFSPPKRQRPTDREESLRPSKAPRSDSSDASGDKLFPKLDDTVTTRKVFNSGGSPAFKLFARQLSVVLERDSADDSSPKTETPAGGSKKRKSPAQSPQFDSRQC
jgi:hypothetical protein